MTRDVAYDSVTSRDRLRLHGQLARYLESASGEAAPVDLLAWHYSQSDDQAKALHYATLAAEGAVRSGAYAEAERAPRARSGRRRPATRFIGGGGRRAVGPSLDGLGVAGHSWSDFSRGEGVLRACPRAVRGAAPGSGQGPCAFGLWTYYLFRGEIAEATDLAREILHLAEAVGIRRWSWHGHFAVSATVFWSGDFRARWSTPKGFWSSTTRLSRPATSRNTPKIRG